MLLMAYFQWRTVSRLAQITAVLPVGRAFGPGGPPLTALDTGDGPLVTVTPIEQSNGRLLGAIDRLEKRIHELEHTSHSPLPDVQALVTETKHSNGDSTSQPGPNPELHSLLGRGESLLNLDKSEEAIACLDQILSREPAHTEALLKKGAALEKLRKLEDAVLCYDRAIAADPSLTIAYLRKGGLLNRMERYSEALECYEKALQTQEKKAAARAPAETVAGSV